MSAVEYSQYHGVDFDYRERHRLVAHRFGEYVSLDYRFHVGFIGFVHEHADFAFRFNACGS